MANLTPFPVDASLSRGGRKTLYIFWVRIYTGLKNSQFFHNKSPLPPLFQIPRNAGLPLPKGG